MATADTHVTLNKRGKSGSTRDPIAGKSDDRLESANRIQNNR